MNGNIRKLKLAYPFKIGDLQKIDIYSIDAVSPIFDGNRIHSIVEEVDPIDGKYHYKIFVYKGDSHKLWKELVPHDCTVDIEYLL